MTDYLLIALGVTVFIWIASKLKKKAPAVQRMSSQIVFLEEYLNYTNDPDATWIFDCKSKDEAIEAGQDKLWEYAKSFNNNIDKLAQSGFQVKAEDSEIMRDVLGIISAVHFIQAASDDKITYQTPVEMVEEAVKEDE